MGLRILIEIDTDTANTEELYLARGVLKMIDAEYQADSMDTPEQIVDKLNSVNAEITSRNRAELTRRLKAAKARREGYRSKEERAANLDKEIADLEAKLK